MTLAANDADEQSTHMDLVSGRDPTPSGSTSINFGRADL